MLRLTVTFKLLSQPEPFKDILNKREKKSKLHLASLTEHSN